MTGMRFIGRRTLITALLDALALASLAWTVVLADPAPVMAAQPSGRCSRHPAYRQDSVARVFAVRTTHYFKYSYALTVYYACARPNGKAVQLAVDDYAWMPGATNDDYVLAELRLAGGYVGAVVVRGLGSAQTCAQAGQPTCPKPYVELTLLEARSRSKGRVIEPDGAKGLALSSAGAAAWLEPASSGGSRLMATGLRPEGGKLKLAPQQLDSGNITGLRFSRRTLHWRNDGMAHSATVSSP